MAVKKNKIIIDEDGISGITNMHITPVVCVKIGCAIAGLSKNVSIGISYSNTAASKSLALAVISGIMASGGTACDFSCGFESRHNFCMAKSTANYGVYIESGIITTIKICSSCGLPLSKNDEEKIQAAIDSDCCEFVDFKAVGKSVSLENLALMYPFELYRLCKTSLDGLSLCVKCNNNVIKGIMTEALVKLGAELNSQTVATITQNGKNLTLFSPETGYIFHERILALVCLSEFLNGNDVAIDEFAPTIIDNLAQVQKKKVYRYDSNNDDKTSKQAFKKASDKLFLRDGMMLLIKLLSFIKSEGISLSEANALIPQFNICSRYIALPHLNEIDFEKIGINGAVKKGNAINVTTDDETSVKLKPIKSGKGLIILAQAANSETSQELCDFYEKKLLSK